MKRTALAVLLTLGMVGGLASGFHHVRHHHARRGAFEAHVADLCAKAALRAQDER